MKMLPVTLILSLAFLAYAAGLGSGEAFDELRGTLAHAHESVVAVVGAALVGFAAGARKAGDGVLFTLDRLLLTVLAVLLLHYAWIGSRTDCPGGPALGLEIEAGNGQDATEGAFLPESLRIRAIGPKGTAAVGEEVGFRLAQGDGRLIFPTRTTGRDGTCENWLRLGDEADACRVEAFLVARPEVAVAFTAAVS
jgi:hypothetical protein